MTASASPNFEPRCRAAARRSLRERMDNYEVENKRLKDLTHSLHSMVVVMAKMIDVHVAEDGMLDPAAMVARLTELKNNEALMKEWEVKKIDTRNLSHGDIGGTPIG